MLRSRTTVTIYNTTTSISHEAGLHCYNTFHNICKHFKHKNVKLFHNPSMFYIGFVDVT